MYSPENTPFAVEIDGQRQVINEAFWNLSSFWIHTYLRALIRLVNMEHVSQKPPLTVVTAMDTHRASTADVNQVDSDIHIQFVSPDSRWKRFPFLPTHLL